jgi:sensor histidine kinase YesM
MMNKPTGISSFLFKRQEFLIFLGLFLWLGIFKLLEKEQHDWKIYLLHIIVLCIAQCPVLFFAWNRKSLLASQNRPQYITIWIACFLIALPLLTLLASFLNLPQYNPMFFITASGSSLLLELLFIGNRYYQSKVQHIKWVKKIGLENAVLITIVSIALTISIMAVSSLNIPEYDKNGQLLIGFEFSLSKLFKYFSTFLSFLGQFLFMYLCGYLFFFINSRFLVSKVLKQQGFLIYTLSLLATVALLYPILAQALILLPINQIFGRDIFPKNPFSMENAFGVLGIMLFSLPVVLSIQWAKQNSTINALEKEKAQSELDLLKQQLNPHFFFNTLNNLYALSLQKSDQTPDSILQLSELMRYVIYKGQEEKALLTEELKYIDDYIQLQKIRLKQQLKLNIHKEILNEKLAIAPLLLITLVENAFKHGIEPAEDGAFLNINITADEKHLLFTCENSFEPAEVPQKPGIGLNNLRRRLVLLYPEKHNLKTSVNNNIFIAELHLSL